MCGFAGFLSSDDWSGQDRVRGILESMADTIRSRGPDDAGVWADAAGIGLAHRRLAIIDTSSSGRQPMACHVGRYKIAFNGEIYNHLELRQELERSAMSPVGGWRGHSDTETLLAGFVAWGIQATVERCVGMFAFAVWDAQARVLTLGRDRLGEKPLYYGWQGSGNSACFLFGSDLRALRAHPCFSAQINRDALRLFVRHNYIPSPHSIYCGVFKLLPASLLTVSLSQREPSIKTYWSLSDAAVSGNRVPFSGSAEQATDMLESLLGLAVHQQMVADVPLGAFLSGGVDSSTVVALMQSQSSKPIRTFSIGFHEPGYNEADHALALARHIGTEHTELYVTSEQARDVIPLLPELYSEPFADSSQIPTYLVSQLAHQHVTVSLSGDGGDELFAGYGRYRHAQQHWHRVSTLPKGFRQLAASGIRLLSPRAWEALLQPLQAVKPGLVGIGDWLHRRAVALTAGSIDEIYLQMLTHWDPQDLVVGGHEPKTSLHGRPPRLEGLDHVQRLMALDAMTYLPDDILTKVDRAAMGVSLEGRMPFLDHRVVEFAWQIPLSMKLRDGAEKWILRQVLYRHVPKDLIERPKMGFGVPIGHWLRGPLRDWVESLLDESRLRREGFFHPEPIRRKWIEHLSGQRDWQYSLWGVLMFQAWLENVDS